MPAIPLPPGSQFNRPREDGAIVTPGTDGAPRLDLQADRISAAPAARVEVPMPSTQSAARPNPLEITGFATAPEAGDAPILPRSADETTLRNYGGVRARENGAIPPATETAPRASEGETRSKVKAVDEPAAGRPPAADADATRPDRDSTAQARNAPSAVGPDVTIETPGQPVPVEQSHEAVRITAPEQAGSQSDQVIANMRRLAQPEPAEDAAPEITVAGASPNAKVRLVPIEEVVDVPRSEPLRETTPDPAPSGEMPQRLVLDSARDPGMLSDAAQDAPVGALDREAVAFDAGGRPLFSVVLIHDPDAEVGRQALTELEFPVTIAIDPTQAGAVDAARAYRDAGHEVVLLADGLPEGGTPQDMEIALSGALSAVPQAIAVLDRGESGFIGDRRALGGLLPPLAEAGMGLLAYPSGLGTGIARANRAGVPAATIFRALDADGERAASVGRHLDRATFEAVQDGAVVVVGRARSETVAALKAWRKEGRAEEVAAAPLSAVLEEAGR
ncbi:polysaccharide deacteylase family 2 protein [Jannaschia seosinensis]|nr:polysaccharide deacteylase family 2 protein [Jannaschia seosinensis]